MPSATEFVFNIFLNFCCTRWRSNLKSCHRRKINPVIISGFFFSGVERSFCKAVSVYMTSSDEPINPSRKPGSGRDSQAPAFKTIIDQKTDNYWLSSLSSRGYLFINVESMNSDSYPLGRCWKMNDSEVNNGTTNSFSFADLSWLCSLCESRQQHKKKSEFIIRL